MALGGGGGGGRREQVRLLKAVGKVWDEAPTRLLGPDVLWGRNELSQLQPPPDIQAKLATTPSEEPPVVGGRPCREGKELYAGRMPEKWHRNLHHARPHTLYPVGGSL